MTKFYTRYSQAHNSFSIFESDRKNEFGEPFCIVPLVSQYEAEQCLHALLAGREAWDWQPTSTLKAAKAEFTY